MKVLNVRNVNQALPDAIEYLRQVGMPRASRYGDVIFGGTVATVYQRPLERVLFAVKRDANPFFHLYESLWMLAGRNDVAGPARYAARMKTFSDDGITFHGAYGERWVKRFGVNQLRVIAKRLKEDSSDRRCVLQIWDAQLDLDRTGVDVPCNVTATFQRGLYGELNLVVFCRSNDIIWGAYGANSVQYSMLLEYMALLIGCPIGVYTQISVNWHGYVNTLFEMDKYSPHTDPYCSEFVDILPMSTDGCSTNEFHENILWLLAVADSGFSIDYEFFLEKADKYPWAVAVLKMLLAHHQYKLGDIEKALSTLSGSNVDWHAAGGAWLRRRQASRDANKE